MGNIIISFNEKKVTISDNLNCISFRKDMSPNQKSFHAFSDRIQQLSTTKPNIHYSDIFELSCKYKITPMKGWRTNDKNIAIIL